MTTNQPIRRLFSMAAMMLALMVLTTATAWAVNNSVSNLPGGWHVVNENAELSSETLPTLTVNNVTSNSAVASWTACDGVTAYTLQLASDGQFTNSGSETTVLTTDFSSTTDWTLSGTGTYTGAGYCGAGSPSIKFDGTGDYAISPDFGSGTKLKFWAFGNNGSGSTFTISGFVNDGWQEIETVSIAQGGATYEVNLPSGTSQVRFDFTKTVNCALDDVVITESTSSIISSITLSGTSFKFTGLDPETTYYARVKGNGDWSEVVSFTTSEPLAPSIAYYQNADGKQGETLKTAMCGIIYNRTEKSYDDLWEAFQTTDVRSDGSDDKIWDMYSNITNYTPVTSGSTYSQEGDCYNREHSWPQSWFGSNEPMYTDLHHIYPTDGFVNGKRANYPFGETNGEDYKSANDFSKLGACTYPGYTGTVFEPADEYKGDFARTYFYMVTCYEEKLHDWYTNYGSTDVVNVIDGSTYPGFQTWQLNMLMKWAKDDPVSEKETNRNNAVYAIQNNRNPFIDYPGLEEYIWGSMTTTAFSYDNYVQPTNAVTVPTLAIDNITSNGADASWTACDGVNEYTLQLASDDQFTSVSNSTVTLFSNNDTNASSAPTGWTYNVSDKTNAYLLMFSGHSVVSEMVDASACTDLSVSLYIRTYGGTSQPNLAIQYSTDNGSTWTDAGTVTANNPTMTQRTLTLPAAAASSALRLRFAPTTTSTSVGVGIQTIVLTGTKSTVGSIIATETVSGTSHTFTGLDPETTYYARVKGNDAWSDVVSFTTQSAVPSAPVLTVPQDSYSVLVGAQEISFPVTATGIPTPTVTATCTEGAYFIYENNEFRFDPDTKGTYHFVFTATNSEGSDSKTVTVIVSGAQASISVPQASYEVTVGDNVNFKVNATGAPEPTVTATCTEGADFFFENKEFLFEPSTVGTYHFVFTATNSEGSESETVTIVVSPAPVTVPELAISDVTSNSAFVSWTECDGVTEYTLQLASDDEFTASSTGGTVTLLTEGFTNAAGSSTAAISDFDAITDNAGWQGSYVYVNDGAVRISSSKNTGDIESPWLTTATAWTTVTLKFDAMSWTNDQTTVNVTVTEDGATYSDPISFTLTEKMDTYTTSFTVYGTQFRVRFAPSAANKRFYLDNVIISSYSEPVEGSIIATETVSGTSHTFTNLAPATTYYARVKGNKGWSDVVDFRTNNATLSLADKSDNSEAIEAAATSGGKYDVTLSNRTLYKDGDWNTLCLPFGIGSFAGTPLEGATVMTLGNSPACNTGFDESTSTLTLDFVPANEIEPGVAYIVKWTKPDGYEGHESDYDISNPTFSGVTIENEAPADKATTSTYVDFIGTYAPMTYDSEDKSVLFLGGNSKLYYPDGTTTTTIGAFRAYFQLKGITASPNSSNVRAFVLNFGDEASEITTTNFTNGTDSGGVWYSLDGRKLDGRPTKSGLYIHGGRKLYVK